MAAGRGAQVRVEAGLRQHQSGVGQRRLGQHDGDVAARERGVEAIRIIEADDDGMRGAVEGRAELAGPRPAGTVGSEAHQRLVDGAVVAAVEHQNLPAAGHGARDAQKEAVGVRGRGRELPVRQPEALREVPGHGDRIGARQHRRVAEAGPRAQHCRDRLRRVTEHRAGVAETEVGVVAAVGIAQLRTGG